MPQNTLRPLQCRHLPTQFPKWTNRGRRNTNNNNNAPQRPPRRPFLRFPRTPPNTSARRRSTGPRHQTNKNRIHKKRRHHSTTKTKLQQVSLSGKGKRPRRKTRPYQKPARNTMPIPPLCKKVPRNLKENCPLLRHLQRALTPRRKQRPRHQGQQRQIFPRPQLI